MSDLQCGLSAAGKDNDETEDDGLHSEQEG